MTRITIRDIAEQAGVSAATVSYVLNNKPGVSDAQRLKIQSIMRQCNYIPTARSVSTQRDSDKIRRVAVLSRDNLHPFDLVFAMELNDSILNACREHGFDAVFTHAVVDENKVLLPEIIRNRQVDGVLINGDVGMNVLYKLHTTGLPIVELDQAKQYDGQKFVTADYSSSAYVGTKHLIDLGHRDIVFITSDLLYDYSRLTFTGFQQATVKSNITLDMNRLQLNVAGTDSLLEMLEGFINSKNLPTAFFCATDTYAVCLSQILGELGLRVPEDISIIAIDDTFVSKFANPPLTAVHIDRDLIARTGLELMSSLIEKKPSESIYVTSDDLMVRRSTAAPRIHHIDYSKVLSRLKIAKTHENFLE